MSGKLNIIMNGETWLVHAESADLIFKADRVMRSCTTFDQFDVADKFWDRVFKLIHKDDLQCALLFDYASRKYASRMIGRRK